MKTCRKCKSETSNPFALCEPCNAAFKIKQCITEITGCLKYMLDNHDDVTEDHLASLVVLRREMGKVIDKHVEKKRRK